MIRLERWTTQLIANRADPDQQNLLHRYAVWHVIRRLRTRLGDADTTYGQAVAAKRNIKAAVALLDWLAARDMTLATAGQGDLDAWLASTRAPPPRQRQLRAMGTKTQTHPTRHSPSDGAAPPGS